MSELLKPRYEVIADYPGSPYNLWQILSEDSFELPSDFIEFDFDKYPHLFRRLEWWEKRELSEMPKYVKTSLKDGIVTKVILHYHERNRWNGKPDRHRGCCITEVGTITYDSLEPATEAEYLEFIKK